jgi:hypothetical protein
LQPLARRFAAERRKRRGLGKPETFNFLGFTFICGKTRQDKFQIKRKKPPGYDLNFRWIRATHLAAPASW